MKDLIKSRFKAVLLDVISKLNSLPKKDEYFIFRKQLIRSLSSSAANYNAACRAKSKKDFIYKLKLVEEELDESIFWVDLISSLKDNNVIWESDLGEMNELLSIVVSSIKTSQKNQNSKISNRK